MNTPMEEVFPTIYSVPFFNEECFLDYTTGIIGAHIADGERAARLLSRTQAREFRETGSTSERRPADAPARLVHDYCLMRVWLSAAFGRGAGRCGCDTHRTQTFRLDQPQSLYPICRKTMASQKAKLACVDAHELDPTVALPPSVHIRNPHDRPSILRVPVGQLEANVNGVR